MDKWTLCLISIGCIVIMTSAISPIGLIGVMFGVILVGIGISMLYRKRGESNGSN